MISKEIFLNQRILIISLLSIKVCIGTEADATKPNIQKSSNLELPCGHPGNIEHGLTDWNGTGPVARFACYQGYYLVGPPKIVCRYGRWFSDVPADRPSCKPVVCSHPNIAHGTLASGETLRYKAGGNAVVVCEDGYQLRQSSNNKLVCREDGSWKPSLGYEFPQCLEKGCLYDDLVIQQPDNGNVEVTGKRDSALNTYSESGVGGIYRPGSVLKYTCHPGSVVVPVVASTRVCRKGRWDGQPGQCVKKSPRFKPQGHCSSPPLINNGYYLSERYTSGEKPYVLPVSGQLNKQFEVGAIARYHCNDGYTLLRLFGQDIYRCSASGVWSPKQPPVCISRTNNMEPLDGMMCGAPDDVAYASYRAVEGVVTPNGALHGTILEYSCNIGYRDTILPCLPSRRTCHAGAWVGALPSCAPFEFCPPVPRIQNGYLSTPREGNYRLHSIVKYGCDRGFWMAGVDTFQCQATGCWEPNALPKCIDENLLSTWSEETGGTSLWAVLLSVCGATAVVSAIMAICGVLACRRKRTPPPSAPAHWSTHVTVTPDCRTTGRESSAKQPQQNMQQTENIDRVALIAFADQDPVVLPSYEEALKEGINTNGRRGLVQQGGHRQHYPGQRRARHQPQDHLPVQADVIYEQQAQHGVKVTNGYGGSSGRGRRRHEPDAVSHTSIGWPARQPSGSNTGSLRSGSVQSVETVGNSEGTVTSMNTETSSTSQTPSCRALAGSLASFDTSSIVNTEGVPLLEENEFETEGSNSVSEHGDTVSAYSESSTKSR